MNEMVKMVKGLNKGMTCTPTAGVCFQYEEGETYYFPEARLCKVGAHACENPLDCFQYYPPGSSVYHWVDLGELTDEHGNDTKRCGKAIKIGPALSVAELCKAHFEYVKARCEPANSRVAGNYESAAAGNRGSAAAGDFGSAAARGTVSVGENGVGVARGDGPKAKGGLGAVLVVAKEFADKCEIADWASGIVDGEKLKPDAWYTVKDGQFAEVKDGTA